MQLRNHFVGLTLSAVCTLGPLGCGDDTSGTGGGSTTSTTSSTPTTTTTTSSAGGAGGEGGAAQGGGGMGGMAQGGGGAGMGGMAQGGGGAGMGGMAQGGGGAGMGGMGGMNMGGGGGGGGTTMTPSQQIAAVLGTADGTGLNLVVADATVTYVKPAFGADPAGFFVQADQMGPALFVAVDPATLTPAPAVGDEVMFTVTAVSTTTGLKHASAIAPASYMRHSQGNDVAVLVSDITDATDVLTNLDGYTSRAVSFIADIEADFTGAGSPQVAAPITTSGLSDPNYRLRMPEAVRATYDLEMGCTLIVDYGVMWRFNAIAQPSALSTNDIAMGDVQCLPPTVAMAQAASSTSVVITFDRLLDPTSVQPSDFMFTGGLMASAVMVNGKTVTVTTSPQMSGTSYTVTVADVTDVLGEAIDPALDEAMFTGYVVPAGLLINEIGPTITDNFDLVELLVTSSGTVNGITLIQDGTAFETIATLPDVNVAMGDIIVVHLNGATAAGAAPGSETMAKNQYAAATYSANYDGAWDFHGGTIHLTNNARVIRVHAPGNVLIDAVPVVLSSSGSPPSAFPGDLQALQALGRWLPADCGGQLCTYSSTPTAIAISVDYLGSGNSPTGNSISRKPGMNTMQKSDWNAAGAQSWGAANP
jgi:hypothetical protein